MTRTWCAQSMTQSQDIPDWVTKLIARIREYQQQGELLASRSLPAEAREARDSAQANIRHLARRLSEGGL